MKPLYSADSGQEQLNLSPPLFLKTKLLGSSGSLNSNDRNGNENSLKINIWDMMTIF